MIITVDGSDGVGKTTLAKKLAEHLSFEYIKDPLDEIVRINGNSENKLRAAQNARNRIFRNNLSDSQIANFLLKTLILLKKKASTQNLIVDRGMLSAAIYNLNDETEGLFDYLLQRGSEMDISILLTSSKEERIRRLKIKAQNNNDPYNDVENQRVLNLDTTRTEQFAISRNLNCIIIDTNNKTEEQVFDEAISKLQQNTIFNQYSSITNISHTTQQDSPNSAHEGRSES